MLVRFLSIILFMTIGSGSFAKADPSISFQIVGYPDQYTFQGYISQTMASFELDPGSLIMSGASASEYTIINSPMDTPIYRAPDDNSPWLLCPLNNPNFSTSSSPFHQCVVVATICPSEVGDFWENMIVYTYDPTHPSVINEREYSWKLHVLPSGDSPHPAYTRCSSSTTTTTTTSTTTTTTLRPVDTKNSCSLSGNSTINPDSLSLGETIPLVGIPFSLQYSSDRFRSGMTFSPKSLGLGGWSSSILHHYDFARGILYTGDGGLRNIQAVQGPSGFYVTDDSGSEIYYFDSNGNHLQTRDSLTGVLKYAFSYDSNGRVIGIVDGFNNSTTIAYESSSATLTSAYGQITTLNFDSAGYLASLTNPNNESYQMTYDSSGYLLSFTKPMGETNQYSYDANGFLTKDQGAGGNFLSFTRLFDSASQQQTVTSTSALNRTEVYQTISSLTGSDHVITSSDGGMSHSTSVDQGTNGYTDKYGNISQSSTAQDPRFGWLAPYNSTSTYSVPSSNISISSQTMKAATLSNSSDPLSVTSLNTSTILQNDSTRIFKSSYSSSNRLITQTSPLNRVVYQALNSRGQVASIQSGLQTAVEFSYDARGRLSAIAQGTRQMSLTYDSHGNMASSKDFLDHLTQYQYDNANRMTQQTLSDGNVIAMTYDKNGNLTSLTPPGRPAHQFAYNLFGYMQSYLPPSISALVSGATTYSYNLDRQITQINRPDGSQVNFNYDPTSGLPSTVATPSGDYTLTYLAKSDLLSNMTSPDNESTSLQYVGNIPISISNTGPISNTMSLSYNTDGSLESLQISGAAAQHFAYDKDGLLVNSGDLSMTRNIVGAVSASTLGKVSESLTYDSYGQTSSDKFVVGKKTIYQENFSRDKLGRIIAVDRNGDFDPSDISYEYDTNGRLTKVWHHRSLVRSYKYDANGNRLEKGGRGGVIKAEYNAQDQLIKYGKNEYSYNASGDLIEKIENHHAWYEFFNKKKEKQKKTDYTYDVFGNLKTVILPTGKRIDYIVDGQNRRVGKKINGKLVQGFIYQSQTQIAAELDGNGKIIKQFIYGSKGNIPDYMIMKSKSYRIISDQIGTPRLLVDSTNGSVVEKLHFNEFGIPHDRFDDDDCGEHEGQYKFSIPFGFAGGLYDEDTGLVRYGARDYDPETGRWTTKDPILFKGGNTNLMSYVANDPVNFVDPRGLWAFQVGGSIGGLLGPILGVGGSAESGIAISYSSQYGLQFAGYQSAGVRAGTGLYGGASLNFSLTPSAQRVGDLNGGGLTGGFDTPIFGGSVTRSGGTCGNPSMNTYTLGVGPGVIGDIYGGATGTHVGAPLTLFGGQ